HGSSSRSRSWLANGRASLMWVAGSHADGEITFGTAFRRRARATAQPVRTIPQTTKLPGSGTTFAEAAPRASSGEGFRPGYGPPLGAVQLSGFSSYWAKSMLPGITVVKTGTGGDPGRPSSS